MDETGIVLSASAALLLRFGLALYLGGAVRAKNAGGILLRIAADFFVVTLVFWAVGMAISRAGHRTVMDWSLILGGGDGRAGVSAESLRILVIALIASGISVGATAERMKFYPALCASALIGGLLVPLVSRWVWHGWLNAYGYHDFAGASVVHVTGAMVALTGVLLVGPRTGKYNRDGSASVIPGHSVVLACAGMVVTLIAWLPYVYSFAVHTTPGGLGSIGMNVLLAGAAAGAASLAYGQVGYGKADIFLTFTGFLGGLVAISASADIISSRGAVVVGTVAGVLVPWMALRIDLIWRIDDPSAGIAAHGVGGIWGILAAGTLTPMTSLGEKFKLLGVQALGLLVIAVTALVLSGIVLSLVKAMRGLRSKEIDEFDGLDLAEHDIGAYPDFQQTTIKSYHLREA